MKYEPGPLTDIDAKDVQEFQADKNLQVDGKIGHQTWNVLHDFWKWGEEKINDLEEEIIYLKDKLDDFPYPPDSPGPVYPPDGWNMPNVFVLIGIGIAIGYVLSWIF